MSIFSPFILLNKLNNDGCKKRKVDEIEESYQEIMMKEENKENRSGTGWWKVKNMRWVMLFHDYEKVCIVAHHR